VLGGGKDKNLRVECIYERVKAWAGTDRKEWERGSIKSE
jgi:hypothetical protein